MGVASGDATETTAVLWTQHDSARELELAVYLMDGEQYLEEAVVTLVRVDAGGFVHVRVNGLTAGARYRYTFFELNGAQRTARSTIGRFRAALSADALEVVTFGASSCTNNGRSMDVLSQAGRRTDLDCFLLLGDTTYNGTWNRRASAASCGSRVTSTLRASGASRGQARVPMHSRSSQAPAPTPAIP